MRRVSCRPITSHPSRSYTLKTSSARLTPCFPSTTIVRTLCAATVISRPRARARFFLSRCRRRLRSALPRRLRLRAKNVLLFMTYYLISLSLSPFLPFVLDLTTWVQPSRPASPLSSSVSGANLVLTHRPIFSLPLSAMVPQFWCHDRWYDRSDLWIQLTVHRQRHRLCRELITAHLDSLPSHHFHGLGPPRPGRQPGCVWRNVLYQRPLFI